MDPYLSEDRVVERLVKDWKLHGQLIIAYDFDDTIYDYWKTGESYDDVIELLKECDKIGAYFIVFTCRGPEDYHGIIAFLMGKGIPYDAINDNAHFVKFTGRKVYFNILLDDKAGLPSAYNCLKQAVQKMKEER